jgi:hypothetical protein
MSTIAIVHSSFVSPKHPLLVSWREIEGSMLCSAGFGFGSIGIECLVHASCSSCFFYLAGAHHEESISPKIESSFFRLRSSSIYFPMLLWQRLLERKSNEKVESVPSTQTIMMSNAIQFFARQPCLLPAITKFDTSETYIILGNSQKEGYILVITTFRLPGANLSEEWRRQHPASTTTDHQQPTYTRLTA